MASMINFVTSSTSPKSTSSNSVQIVQPPSPTVIDLTVESIEDLMMAVLLFVCRLRFLLRFRFSSSYDG
jgi:hypothetical protein